MKIYNEITSIFNELTGKWETISEDSYEYDGPLALAQGSPPNSSAINASDTITDTIKTTAGYFTNGDGTLEGSTVYTGSLSDSNEKYYFNVTQAHPNSSSAETQFSVTFGHYAGSGSNCYGDSTTNPSTLKGETQAIYSQLANLLLEEQQISGGFKIASSGDWINPIKGGGPHGGTYMSSSQTATVAGAKDDYVYALIGKRARFKDRMNKKSWTMILSGSDSSGQVGKTLKLTDDSATTAAVATPGGPRYNIISGTLGTPYTSSAHATFGWFYPEMGIMLFSGIQLSASIPGGPVYSNGPTTLPHGCFSGSSNTTQADDTGTPRAMFLSASDHGNAALNVTSSLAVGDMIKIHSSSNAGEYTQWNRVIGLSSTSGDAYANGVAVITMSLSASATYFPNQNGATGKVIKGLTVLKGHKRENVTQSFDAGIAGTAACGTKVGNSIFSSSGFAPNLDAKGNPKNALNLVNSMRMSYGSTALRLRSEEDQTQENYFCRIKAAEYNFSSNPTFVSGSKNKMRNTDMFGNPQTFLTGVGLYNSAGQLLAIAKLSSPLKKNFASEATIKVKLTY